MQPDDFKALEGCCLTCGYLSKWEGSGRVYEFAKPDRFIGKAFYQELPGGATSTTMPHCLRGISFLTPEENLDPTVRTLPELEQAAVVAFQRRRNCPKWYPHREGLSPQGHLEEQRAFEFEQRREEFEQRIEEGRQAFEMDMETGRRNFEVAMAERAEKFNLALAERTEKMDKRYRNTMVGVGIVGAFLIVAEIFAVVFGASPGSLLGDLLGR